MYPDGIKKLFEKEISVKILVAGGAGFIGSHVADSYISDGHETVVVDSLASGNRDNLNMSATFYEVDLCDQAALEDVFVSEQPDYVNHHAAQVDVRRAVEDLTTPTKMLWVRLISLSVVVSILFRRSSMSQAAELSTENRFHSP